MSAQQSPSEKGSTLEAVAQFAPLGANTFLLEQNPFQKGGKSNLIVTSHES